MLEHRCKRQFPRGRRSEGPFARRLDPGADTRRPRRLAAVAAAWLALPWLAVLALGASPAGAEVFVSNMNQAAAQLEYADYGKKEYAEGRITTTHERVYVPYASQRFGTGPNAAGYTLEEVRLDIVALAGSSSMAVALFSDNAGRPGSLMAEFYPVDGFTTGTVRLRARRQSGAYPRLQPNTYYHVEFQQRHGHVYWSITDSDVEDGANGWSLDDDGWSFISVSNHDETHGGVGLLGEMGRGEYGDPSPWSPGFDVVTGWTAFPRAFRMQLLGSTVTGSAPELDATYSRAVTENAAPGTAVGDPVTASDADGDAISYELAGRDAGAFAIDAATGQLRTKAGVFYDYEIKNSYTVTVVADDGNGNTDTAVVTIALTNVAAEVLTADIEGAPAAHNGAPFVVHLVFSEPTSLGFRTVRDSLLSVTNGRVTRARRADLARGLKKIAGDHLSARWEVTVEPAGGDVTIALPATTDCDAAAAVCTRDRRPLSAGVSEAVAAGTVPVLTASFAGAPEEHDGSEAFTLELNFNAAVTTSRGDMRTHALRVTNGRLTGASRQRGRRDRWLLTVEPSSLKDVTVALSATASCDDSGAVCAVDGRILSSPEEVSVIGPASIPLTGEGEKHLPVYRREPFEFGIKFSWAVKITPAAMKQHAFTVTNAEIVSAYKVGDDSGRHWRITALPLSTRLIEIVLPATTDCADPGAVCTRDGRMLSNEYDWFFMYMYPDRVDETAPAVRRAEVDGATLVLLFTEGLDEASTPAADAFTVTVAGTERSLAAADPVTVKGRRVTLTLASPAAHGQAVTLSYTLPSGNPLRDVAGNDAEALSQHEVTNHTPEGDTSAPALQSAAANNDYVMLTYDEPLDEASTPAADAFTVTVAGTARDLASSNPVSVSGRTVTLTLASPLSHGETVTVSYAAPSSNPLQDAAGNDAAALNGQAASNRSPGGTSQQNSAEGAATAAFHDLPTSHGMELFTFELRLLGGAFEVSYLTLRDKAFSVMNGTVTKAKRVSGGNDKRWLITVDPAGAGNVVVTLPAVQDCEDEAAICGAPARPLADSVMAIIPETPPVVTEDPPEPEQPAVDPNGPLTVKFEEGSVPATHNGHDLIVFRIAFSHEPKSSYGYMTLRNKTLVMKLGGVTIHPRRAFKLEPPSGKRWEIVVSQMRGAYDPNQPLTVVIGPTLDCDDTGAVCTEDGRMLSNRISARIEYQPVPELAVADAPVVREAADTTLEFAVTLSETASEAVTVDYATSDSTTTAGEDYADTSGTLTFAAGETAKTVQVEVVDDSVDERIEQLWLELSNPSGGRIADAIGWGIIWDDEPGIPVTAWFEDVPASHDGSTEFTFELRFDEEFAVNWRALQESVFQVTNGRVTAVRRLHAPGNRRWVITVRPASPEAVVITLPRRETCEETGALCTEDGRGLAAPVSATVAGPSISVADARVQEAAGATVDFAVSLTPAAAPVTVDYATSDVTATAGADYTEASGTLTFGAGETSKTVRVAVLDDAIDEGPETFTLTLSNPSGGGASVADAEATGTIENSDPMPRAWLARFGRTVASQAVDAIGGRLEARGGPQITVGGQTLGVAASPMVPEGGEDAGNVGGMFSGTLPAGRTAAMTEREFLLGSSFRVGAGGEDGGSAWTAWGRFTAGGFDAVEDGVRMDGSVTSGFVGADVGRGNWLAGLALSLSDGEGEFAFMEEEGNQRAESTLTALYPYARMGLTEKVDAWGLAGYGTGELTLKLDKDAERTEEETYKTDVEMRMGAAGVRGEVLSPETPDGLRVAVKSDLFWVRTTSEAVRGDGGNLRGSEADVGRVRVIVEGSRRFAVWGGTLTPSLEVGLRHDGGDAEEGTGVEAGAGFRYAGTGVTVGGSVRALVAREGTGYEEWGASGAVRFEPGGSGRGFSLTLSPAWGAPSSGVGRLWSLRDARGLARDGEFEAGDRLEAEVGYGLGLVGAPGVLTPYAGLSLVDGRGRKLRGGARWRMGPGAALELEAARTRDADGEGAEYGLMLRGSIRW